ncbi:MAE_28990/MAE_18760 family HEPN-like nuclease [Phaeocystidibacter marisrubri]|uniref:MAE-28990/MAE-18760-like HEPN domain-containing protein n=1 Tax=Phaeocystidibacter marisrubri TaxID=1577780 RepID=A0A6L3ZE47_9FLAO|nr:MAE_28990/MAE_18760 family HEPN-like nuclease [Phaeocystidibacter marisrubri]KAB2816101.1 hypothetical protein F8C82_10445 [Phaeocystidibacter marisrubri]GGH67333.1 hypothetical protein GCM10011318_06200 [Phaeocystidibacter marisrubri]
MNAVIQEFEKRVDEIDVYFKHLEAFLEDDAQVYFPNKQTHKYKTPDPTLQKVLKANCFLLIYNLVESSVRLAITHVHDHVSNERLTYREVIDEIRLIWIKEEHNKFRDMANSIIVETLRNLENEVFNLEYTSSGISGNIDSRKINEFCDLYGFPKRVHHTAGDGSQLHIVKQQRNSLAHGNISFSECGRSYTFEQLIDIKVYVSRYVKQFLNNVSRYLRDQQYRTARN